MGLSGVINYAFDEYRIQPTASPSFVPENPRTAAPVLPGEGSLTVASFNVLNYFNGNGLGGGYPTARGANSAGEFERQRAKIINALVAMAHTAELTYENGPAGGYLFGSLGPEIRLAVLPAHRTSGRQCGARRLDSG